MEIAAQLGLSVSERDQKSVVTPSDSVAFESSEG